MDGEILRPMYVLVGSEKDTLFPTNKPDDPPNIRSFPGTTANMSKSDLRQFHTEAMWPSMPADRSKVLLLVDAWKPNEDDALSDQCKPDDVQLIKGLIPARCTGMIQPLDVHFFRMYKSFVRYVSVTDTVINETEINLWHRDRFLALQSFVPYQFSAPRFRNMIRYAFYKAGYTDEEPGSWVSPHDYCFNDISVGEECFVCGDLAFVKCAHCGANVCIQHSFCSQLHINCTDSNQLEQ